jgi:hypothetical protein
LNVEHKAIDRLRHLRITLDPGCANLRKPGSIGATIAILLEAFDWQQHSVRGFSTGVVRKTLELKLGSVVEADQRVYRIVTAVTKQDSDGELAKRIGVKKATIDASKPNFLLRSHG